MKLQTIILIALTVFSTSIFAGTKEFRLVLTNFDDNKQKVEKTFSIPVTEMISVELNGIKCSVDATGIDQTSTLGVMGIEIVDSGKATVNSGGLIENNNQGFLQMIYNGYWCFVRGL